MLRIFKYSGIMTIFIGTTSCVVGGFLHAAAYYIDPDYSGTTRDGSADRPWNSLGSSQWVVIDSALIEEEVTVYFSAREAGSDVDEISTSGVLIYRADNSSNRVILDGMSKYNMNDENPTWSEHNGLGRHQIKAGYPMLTGQVKRNYVTIRGFKIIAGVGAYGGQVINYWGGDHVIIEYNEITHDPSVVHGAALQFGYAHQQGGGGNGGCEDVIIRNNLVHDTYGEGIYIGGSENTGLPAHNNVLIENNIVYNCGRYGGEGDCIDPKDEITNLVIRNNHCYNGYGSGNVNGIPSSSAIIATGNIIHDMPNKGISIGTYWGRGFSGSVIANNLIYNNGSDGVYIGTDTVSKPISNTDVFNNTIFSNAGAGVVVGSGGGGISDLSIINNIIMNNNRGIAGWGSSTCTISFNDVFGNDQDYGGPFTDQTGMNGNISEDPSFVNASDGNFHLLSNSLAIDAGTEVNINTDIEGVLRPQGAGWDIGAYEFQEGIQYIVSVYPNPCRVYRGENFVTFFGALSTGDIIEIYDTRGKIVHESGNLFIPSYQWSTSSVPSGIYFFATKSADSQKKAKGKVVIIR